MRKKAGIEEHEFYDLRHSVASHPIMKSASLKEVREILGHKNVSMTI